jgi:hypothetical protein
VQLDTWLIFYATIFGGFIGGGGVLVWDWLRRWWRKPIVVVTADPHHDRGCLAENAAQLIDGRTGKAIYARVRVGNRGRDSAQGAIAFLTKIRLNGRSVEGSVVGADWSFRTHAPMNIPGKFDGFYLDIFAVFADDSNNVVGAGICGRDRGFDLIAGGSRMRELEVEVVVSGDNFDPVRKRVHLRWNGTFPALQIAGSPISDP